MIFELLTVEPGFRCEFGQNACPLLLDRRFPSTFACSLTPRLVTYRSVGTRNIYRVDPEGVATLRAYLDSLWAESLGRFQDRGRKKSFSKAKRTDKKTKEKIMKEEAGRKEERDGERAPEACVHGVLLKVRGAWWPLETHHIGAQTPQNRNHRAPRAGRPLVRAARPTVPNATGEGCYFWEPFWPPHTVVGNSAAQFTPDPNLKTEGRSPLHCRRFRRGPVSSLEHRFA